MKVGQPLMAGVPVTVKSLKDLQGAGVEILAKEVLKTVATTSGGVAITTTSWHAFQASHTVTPQDVLKGLLENGVTPEKAPGFVGPVHDFIKSDPTRLLFVAVTGGGMGITILEATRKMNVPWRNWSQLKILLVGGITGAIIVSAIYLTLKHYGIMN